MASIRKIEGKGGVSYKITVAVGRDDVGKQIRHYKTWRPDPDMSTRQIERELQRVAVEFEQDILGGFQVDNRQTFEEFAEYVYMLREQRGDKPQTLERVKRQTARINEHIGHMKLTAITPRQLNTLYKKLSEPGSNQWMVYASPVVDFNELRGNDNYNEFARKCGVYGRIIANLCRGKKITRKTASIIEEHLGRNDLFEIVGTGKSLSPGTIRDYHAIIAVVLEQAYKEMILKHNPANRATLPKKRRVRETDAMQPDLVRRVLEALENEHIDFRTMITLFIATGCRRGEILGLKWDRIDMDACQIKIDRTINYLKERGVYEGTTKTENVRYIMIPPEIVALLKKYRAWQFERRLQMGDQWQEQGYLFTRADGRPLNPGTVNCLLTAFCEKHGFPHINPHRFRHTAASILISRGVDVLTVSHMLGHSDTSTTLDTYGHHIEEAQKKAAACISDVFIRRNRA